MSILPGNLSKISVRVLCQLTNETESLGQSEIIRFDDSCYYVGGGNILFYIDTTHNETTSVNCIEGIVSIALFSYENRILFALNADGYPVALHCQHQQVEFLSFVDLDNQLQADFIHNGRRFIRYDAERNVLIMTVGDFLSVSAVNGFINDKITTSTLYIGQHESSTSSCSLGLWGNNEVFMFAYSSSSSDFSVRVLTKCMDEQDGEPKWHVTDDATEIRTKHKYWISALSEATGNHSDIFASGDCAGNLILYTLSTNDQRGKYPLKMLLANDSLCEGNAITSILLNPQQNDLWIGDISGAITSAHLSVKSKSLHPTRRLTLFGTVGGPSYLHWQPSAPPAELSTYEIQASQQKVKTKASNSGLLTTFSPACGMLVECTVMESIESIFRVSPEPAVTQAGALLEGDSKGKLSAEEVSALSPSVVDACALLPHLNLMAVTSARSRAVYLWDLHSGLLQHSIPMDERFCTVLSAFDAPVPEITVTGAPVRNTIGNKRQAACVAAGHSNGHFVLINLSRSAAPESESVHMVASTVAAPAVRESRPSRVSAYESAAASSTAARPRLQSAHDVDILDAVGPQQSLEYGVGMGGGADGADAHYRDDDDRSDTSEVSLGRFHGADGASDDDSVGGGPADYDPPKPRRKQRNSSIVTMRRTSVAAAGPMSHSIELATRFCPLPITDILFSTSGKFIAICHIKKVIVVYNNHVDAKKVSLRVSFDEMFCAIQVLVPSELSAERDRGRDPHENYGGRRDSDDRTFMFTDASRRASVPSAFTGSQGPPRSAEQDEESLVLMLQSPTQIRLLDAIKGTILTQFGADGAGAPIVSSAAWDVPAAAIPRGDVQNERAVTGICVAQDMRIFLFGGDSGEFRQYRLHDQHGAPQVPCEMPHVSTSLISSGAMNSWYFAGHLAQASQTAYQPAARDGAVLSRLDNLVQGVSINELRSFSPLACVWSLRRLALLRMQLSEHTGAQVLRSEEYCIGQPNVRIVYASGLKAAPRMRNHRAVLVLSNGHIIVMHL